WLKVIELCHCLSAFIDAKGLYTSPETRYSVIVTENGIRSECFKIRKTQAVFQRYFVIQTLVIACIKGSFQVVFLLQAHVPFHTIRNTYGIGWNEVIIDALGTEGKFIVAVDVVGEL